MKKTNFLKATAIAGILTLATQANAQIVLTKTLPPIGTTYEVWSNVSLPSTTVAPDTGANIIWDYSTITTTKANDVIIRGLSEVPSSEQTAVPNAVYVEEQLLPGAPNTDWLPRVFYQDNGDFLIEIAKKNFGTNLPTIYSDTVFEFNLPYQSSTTLNFGPTGGSGEFVYAGYGTLIIGSETHNNVVLLKEDVAPDTLFYFFTLTPHYHRLARIFFQNGQRIINYYKPTGSMPTSPAAPTNLTATPVNSIELNWQDNSNNEDGFYIESTLDTVAGSWTQIATVGADTTTYLHTGLTNGVTYFYRVSAFNGNGTSSWSNIAGATDIGTSISDIYNQNSLSFYPNPSNTSITIDNIPIGSTIKITDISGKTVYNSSVLNEHRTTINTSDLADGIYIICLDNKGNIISNKLLINR